MNDERKKRRKLFQVYSGMIERCYSPKSRRYKDYGARNIFVCYDWQYNFEIFFQWAITNGFDYGLSIDRIDNDDGYYPENCRWADRITQARNKRNTLKVDIKGNVFVLADLADELGIPYDTLYTHWRRHGYKNKVERKS